MLTLLRATVWTWPGGSEQRKEGGGGSMAAVAMTLWEEEEEEGGGGGFGQVQMRSEPAFTPPSTRIVETSSTCT